MKMVKDIAMITFMISIFMFSTLWIASKNEPMQRGIRSFVQHEYRNDLSR